MEAGGLWIGWRQRYEGPIAEAVLNRLSREKPGHLGYVEISCGAIREALFSRMEIFGKVRWTLEFIREDGDVMALFPLYDHPAAVESALRVTAANAPQMVLF